MTLKQYKEAARFWGDIKNRVENCITYMRNDAHDDETFIALVIKIFDLIVEMCEYRKKEMLDKANALETLAGEK